MSGHYANAKQYIEARSLRERAVLFAVALLVVLMIVYVALIEPLVLERQRQSRQVVTLSRQIEQQQAELTTLTAQLSNGVHAAQERQRDRLNSELFNLEQQLNEAVVALIPPRLMPQVLETILSQHSKLKLLHLENKPVEALLVANGDSNQQADQSSQDGLYKHSFVITLRGSYTETVRYFQQLEQLPWRFYWDTLNYRVDKYPNAVVTLEVHTVSTDREWLGV